MPKMMFLVAASAIAGAALTYLATRRRPVTEVPGSGASLTDRARSMGDRIKATFQNATGARRQTAGPFNTAFEQHRAETLARLEAEQRQFKEFLNKLRQAKDQAEFDAFMGQRQPRSGAPMPPPPPDAPPAA